MKDWFHYRCQSEEFRISMQFFPCCDAQARVDGFPLTESIGVSGG